MKSFFLALLLAVSNVFAGEINVENTPPPIDNEMIEQIWNYLKTSLNAPKALPAPKNFQKLSTKSQLHQEP